MLFESSINLKMKDADVVYYPNFFHQDIADTLFENLLSQINWKQDSITAFGKTHLQPRLTAFYANNKNEYKYSNIIMQPHSFSGDLHKIKKNIETVLNIDFTSCLANLYRYGKDSNGWHADDEKELGENLIIASVSFGAERIFQDGTNYCIKKPSSLKLGFFSICFLYYDARFGFSIFNNIMQILIN